MKEVVSVVFINDKNSILALKRSPHKTYYPNVWDTVVGKKEDDETVNECLRREVQEELGSNDFEVKKQTEKMIYKDGEHKWYVTLFLCKLKTDKIILNKEHTEYRWFDIVQLQKEECSIPFLKDLKTLSIIKETQSQSKIKEE